MTNIGWPQDKWKNIEYKCQNIGDSFDYYLHHRISADLYHSNPKMGALIICDDKFSYMALH